MSDLQLQMFFLGKFVFSGAQQDFYQSELTGNYGSICLNRTHLHINDKKDLKLTSVDKIVGSLSVQSMNGFVFIIDEKGTFIYVSETVSHYLGTSQVDLMGYSILKFINHSDIEDFKAAFSLKEKDDIKKEPIPPTKDNLPLTCSVRMKCPLNKRGTLARCSGYQVVFLSGYHVTQTYTKLSSSRSSKTNTPPKESSEDKDENETTHIMYFIHAQTLPPTMLSFDQLNEKSFVIRLDHSFRITYCEEQLTIL